MCFSKVNENNQSYHPFFHNDFNWKKGIGGAVIGLSVVVALGGALSLIATTGVLPNALVFAGDPVAISMVVGGTFVAIATGIVLKKLCETPAYVFSNDLETDIFEIESESESSLSLDEEALDCIETEEEMRAAFKENILNLYKTKRLPEEPVMPKLTEEERLLVEAAYNFTWDRKEPVDGFKLGRSGSEFRCFTLEQMPGWIFKAPSYRSFGDEYRLNYVKKMEKERSFVQKNHLYFLHVPKSQSVNVTDHAFNQELWLIMEEKLDFETNEAASYQWALEQEDLKEAMKELFRQFLFFICKRRFSDVKLNNAPMTKMGRVGLYDLDSFSAMTGLFRGRGGIPKGFFSLLPEEWLEEFIDLAKKQFYPSGKRKVDESFNTRKEVLLDKAKKRSEKRAAHQTFLNAAGIRYTAQQIDPDVELNLQDKRRDFALKIIELSNQQLKDRKCIDIVKGRTVSIRESDLFDATEMEDWDQFKDFMASALEALKRTNLICSFRRQSNHPSRYIFKL